MVVVCRTNSKWKPYSEYKDSSVEWVGNVPEPWIIERLKFNSYIKGRIGWQNLRSDEFTDEGPYLITGMHFLGGSVDWDSCYHITKERYDMAKEIQVREHDILITKDGSIGKVAYIDHLPGEASLNSHLLIIRPLNNQYIPRYLFYLLNSSLFTGYISLTQTGTTFFGITQESVENFPIHLPSIDEQYAIAVFLDRETSKIDALIAKKERLIELLQDKRATLISHAVTKGLDPNVPMKNSGEGWIGEIPTHWQVKQLKRLAKLEAGSAITSERIEEAGEYPVFGGNGIRGFTSSYTHEGSFPIIGRQGALCGCVNSANGRFWASEHAVVAAPNPDVNPYWLAYLLQTMSLNAYSQSAAQPGLAVEKISALRTFISPITEQCAVTSFLDHETAKIDALIQKIQESIGKQKEYRIALISAAVTGKIDIRNEVGGVA